jgi:hypothetical protein
MLQRMLGSHPDVHTTSEPWLMLHPFYALRDKGIRVEFDSYKNNRLLALHELLNAISDGDWQETYYQGVRRMYSYFYGQALKKSGKRVFLDKTPRYYHIIPELHQTFPQAKFIILLRNPLAVLNSILRSWVQGDWFWLSHTARRHDLLSAPVLLVEGIEYLGDHCLVVHYEQLVKRPNREIARISKFLSVDPDGVRIDYENSNKANWKLGDHKVYSYKRPVAKKAHAWKKHTVGPQTWRLLHDYLFLLGEHLVEDMGYSYGSLIDVLDDLKPKGLQSAFLLTLPLEFLVESKDRRTFLERNLIRILQRYDLLSSK